MDTIVGSIGASAAQYSPNPIPAPGPATVPASFEGAATAFGVSGAVLVAPAAGPEVTAGTDASNSVSATTDPNGKSHSAPSLAQVQKAVDDINSTLKANQNTSAIQFAIDPSSKKIVVQMLDTQTGKVISQYPSEQIIQMGLALGKKLGQLVNQQA